MWDTRSLASRLCAVRLWLLHSSIGRLLGLLRWIWLMLWCVRRLRLVLMHLECRSWYEACLGVLLLPRLCDLYADGPQCRVACLLLTPACNPYSVAQPAGT